MSGAKPVTAEVRRVQMITWGVLLTVTAVVAVLTLADDDVTLLAKGVLGTAPVLELMIAWFWWRRSGRPGAGDGTRPH